MSEESKGRVAEVLWAGLLDGVPSRVVAPSKGPFFCEEFDKSKGAWVPTSFSADKPFSNPPAPRADGGPYGCWVPPPEA